MSRTLGFISIKGGVGKTTIASSVASSLANHYGRKVLLIDANFSAPNLGLHMDIVKTDKTIHHVLDGKMRTKSAIVNKYGVDVIPGSCSYARDINPLKLKDKIEHLKNEYDFIILDSSPALNDEILACMLASDNIFVVTTPDYPTLSCSLRAAKLARQRGKPISGIVINKIRDPWYELSLKEIEEAVGIPVVARIKDDKTNIRALFTRIPTSVYNSKCTFAREIRKFGAAISGEKEKLSFFQRFLMSGMVKEEVNRQLLKESFYSSLSEMR